MGNNIGKNLVSPSVTEWDDDSLPSWFNGSYVIVPIQMLEFFYDEGGSGSKLIVSVQVYSRRDAEKLCRAWTDELRKFGVKYFHSKDFGNVHKGVFKGLSELQRKLLLSRLAALIHKHAHSGVSAIVDTDFYDREIPPDCKSQWTSAYAFAVTMALGFAYVNLEREKRGAEGINILLATGHRNLTQATQRLEEFKIAKDVIPVKTWSCGEMADHPTLQTADIIAYASWQSITDRKGDIFHAIHPKGGSRYQHLVFECNEDLIQILKNGWNK